MWTPCRRHVLLAFVCMLLMLGACVTASELGSAWSEKQKQMFAKRIAKLPKTLRYAGTARNHREREVPLRSLEDTELFNKNGTSNVQAGDCFYDRKGDVYCLPIMAIVGAQKGGTSIINQRLRSRYLFKRRGETHFYDGVHNEEELAATWQSYPKKFPVDPALLSSGQVPFYIDKSPNYTLTVHHAAEFASRVMPSMISLMAIREPGSRMYSAFQHNCRHSRYRTHHETGNVIFCNTKAPLSQTCQRSEVVPQPCSPDTFDNHIESSGAVDKSWWNMWTEMNEDEQLDPAALFSRSYYKPQIEHWAKNFPNRQLFILFNEDLGADTHGALRAITDYIGVPATPLPDIASVLRTAGRYTIYQPMTKHIRGRLNEHYCDHNKQLETMFGLPLPGNWACQEMEDPEGKAVEWVVTPVALEPNGAARTLVDSVEASRQRRLEVTGAGTPERPIIMVARRLPVMSPRPVGLIRAINAYTDSALSTPRTVFVLVGVIIIGCSSLLLFGLYTCVTRAMRASKRSE